MCTAGIFSLQTRLALIIFGLNLGCRHNLAAPQIWRGPSFRNCCTNSTFLLRDINRTCEKLSPFSTAKYSMLRNFQQRFALFIHLFPCPMVPQGIRPESRDVGHQKHTSEERNAVFAQCCWPPRPFSSSAMVVPMKY